MQAVKKVVKIRLVRIGIYDPYLDDLGGGEKYMMKIAQCLAQEHDVSVFWNTREDVETLKKRFLLDLSKIRFAKNIFAKGVSKTARLNESRKYDAFILLSDGSIPLLFSKKIYIHFQQPLNIKRLNLRTKLKIRRVKDFFCNSYYTKSFVDKTFGINSLVLYPPVEIKPRDIKKENVILHVGRFRVRDFSSKEGVFDYKKQEFMIGAFKKMVDEGLKNWRFILAVSIRDEDKDLFERLIDKAKGYPIEFLINKNNDELWEAYSKAKIYWHASGYKENLEANPEYAEHFGISTVEAMGGGVVPVVINAGGQREIIEDKESGFLWENEEQLREITRILTENETLRKKVSANAIKRSKMFTEERFCEQLRDIIK